MKTYSIRIDLPFPDSDLSPNARKHWTAKQEPKKAARDTGFYLALPFRLDHDEGISHGEDIELQVNILPPDRRKHDIDNVLAAMKPYLDGVCTALEIDDAQFQPIVLYRHKYKKNHKDGGVVIVLTWKVDDAND
jgi:crossover junction endodeoxyribonuclease RusA